MSLERVKDYFSKFGLADRIHEFNVSSATVELAAAALGVEGSRIAKTLSFRNKETDGCILVVAAGDARVDNTKFKSSFGIKAKMLTPEEVMRYVGYAVGGVCPFGIDPKIPVYLDESLKRYKTVYPACGSSNSAIELTCDEMYEYSRAIGWVDVFKTSQDSP